MCVCTIPSSLLSRLKMFSPSSDAVSSCAEVMDVTDCTLPLLCRTHTQQHTALRHALSQCRDTHSPPSLLPPRRPRWGTDRGRGRTERLSCTPLRYTLLLHLPLRHTHPRTGPLTAVDREKRRGYNAHVSPESLLTWYPPPIIIKCVLVRVK